VGAGAAPIFIEDSSLVDYDGGQHVRDEERQERKQIRQEERKERKREREKARGQEDSS
jgi:hypothetical protein